MPGFPVIDDILAIFGVSSHGTRSIAFVIASVDLFCGEPQSRGQDRRRFEHDDDGDR